MRLDKLQLVLKPRSYWQAIDLGLKVSRHYYWHLFTLSLLLTSLVLLLTLSLSQSILISALLIFWFKPLIERPLLFYISRAIFAEDITPRDVLLQIKAVLRPQWLASYSWRRISLSRSFNDPVVLLEGLEGEQRQRRLQLLSRINDGAFWLTFLCFSCEILLYLGLALLPAMILPDAVLEWITRLVSQQLAEDQLYPFYLLLCYSLSVALVAPFYSVCGFVLYLNRRTSLEAWHLELGFRRLAQRFASQAGRSTAILLASLSLLLAPALQPRALADEPAPTPTPTPTPQQLAAETSDDALTDTVDDEIDHDLRYPLMQNPQAQEIRQQLDQLLDSDTFGEHYQDKQYDIDWDLDWDWELGEDEIDSDEAAAWLQAIESMLGYLKLSIIIMLVALLGWVLLKYRPWRYFTGFSQPLSAQPDQVLGFDVKHNNLPDQVLDQIRCHIDQGERREALSLMFRCHLSKAIRIDQVPFKRSSTEEECLRLMQQHCPAAEAQSFARLAYCWQQLAYAHQPLALSQLQALFNDWQPFVEEHV